MRYTADEIADATLDLFHSQVRQIEKRANTVLLMQILLSLGVAGFCIGMLAANKEGSNTTLYSSLLSWTLGWWVSSPTGGGSRMGDSTPNPMSTAMRSEGSDQLPVLPSLTSPGTAPPDLPNTPQTDRKADIESVQSPQAPPVQDVLPAPPIAPPPPIESPKAVTPAKPKTWHVPDVPDIV